MSTADGLKIKPQDAPFLKTLYSKLELSVRPTSHVELNETLGGNLCGMTVVSNHNISASAARKILEDICDACNFTYEQTRGQKTQFRITSPSKEVYCVQFTRDLKAEYNRGMDLLLGSLTRPEPAGCIYGSESPLRYKKL